MNILQGLRRKPARIERPPRPTSPCPAQISLPYELKWSLSFLGLTTPFSLTDLLLRVQTIGVHPTNFRPYPQKRIIPFPDVHTITMSRSSPKKGKSIISFILIRRQCPSSTTHFLRLADQGTSTRSLCISAPSSYSLADCLVQLTSNITRSTVCHMDDGSKTRLENIRTNLLPYTVK